MTNDLVSIIIPAMNEEDNLENTIKGLVSKLTIPFEIVIVNDNSTDKTGEIGEALRKKDNRIRIVHKTTNPGFGHTLKVGFKKAKGEFVIPVMADLCDDPETINKMYEKAKKGYDIVSGSRYIKGGDLIGSPYFKGWVSRNYGRLIHWLVGIQTHDITNAFKLYRRSVINNIEINQNDFSISVEMPLKAFFNGAKVTEVPTIWRGRNKGQSKFKFFKMGKTYFKFLRYGIKRRFKK